ncbi:MAG: zinc ribbon domain-containing protein [Ruminococcus sp.]|nr:zinc ribbon domain-containing protein [Ruminococcus sp.]
MGTFFEDLGKRLGETAETMTNKAGEAMEIQKLKNQIRTLERSNENDLAALGRMVYDQFKEGGHMSEEASGLCEAIQSREESIDEYLQKIVEVKGEYACPSCGKMVGRDMAYCPYCGEKAPEKPKAESVSMEEKLKNAREKAGEYADKAADVINEMAGKAGEYASEAIDKASEYAEKAMEKAGEYADKVAEKMEDAAENVVDVMEETVETAATEAGEAVKDEAAEAVEEATGDGEDKAE